MTGDEITATSGDETENMIAGKANQQQVIKFTSADNAILWSEIVNLRVALDDLPNRVGKLEVIYKPATSFEKIIFTVLGVVVVVLLVIVGILIYLWARP